jgi:DNA helicase-2/ATP-dependent DNA helicase PcrA
VSHTDHSDALLGIINVPPRRIGDETIKQLTTGAEKAQVTLWTFIKDVVQGRRSTEKKLQKAAELGLCSLVKLIEASKQKLQDCEDPSAPCVLLEYITESLSFQEYLLKTYPLDEDGRWANVKELMGQANDAAASDDDANFEEDLPEIEGVEQQQSHPGEEALSRFLANVALATEAQTQDEGEDGQGSVTISTIHAAKGLEWPVVFIPAVYNGSIPHSRAEVVDEERRLLYVAMTRAQALLYLSLPLKQPRMGEGEDGSTTLTPFLPPKLVKTRLRPKGPQFHEKVVYGIADILHRPRPSPEDMCKDIATLPSLLDDKWTSEGEEVRDDNSEWNGKQGPSDPIQEPYPKRRRSDNNGPTLANYTTAGNYSTNFTVATTMSSGGFTSARNYIAVNPAAGQKTTTAPTTPSSTTGVGPGGKAKAPSNVSRKDGLTQASLSNFLGGPGSSAQKTESVPAIRPPPQPAPRNHLTPQTSSRSGASFVPPSLSSHRLQPRPLHPSRPVLEPAEPSNYTWMAATSRPDTVRSAQMRTSQPPQGNGNGTLSLGTGTGAGDVKQERSTNGVRSVTFYTTTMDKVRQQVPAATGRRTLGIRRSMNGWEERMKREKGGSSSDQTR